MTPFKENDNGNANPDESIVEATIDPWQELQTGFKGIRLLKNPTRILEIRNNAQLLKVDYNEQITTLDSQLEHMSDPLDKLSVQHRITGLKKRISAIDRNLAVIASRVKELVKKYKSESAS